MKLEEYNLLNKDQQYVCWLSRSVAIARYETPVMVKVLYQLDSFYIEISFLKHDPYQSYFTAFADTDMLNRYLVDIDISGIGIA